jgi:hypothetical protein
MKTALILIIAASAILSGCVSTPHENFYLENYRSNTVGATNEQLASAFYPSDKNPQIIRTNLRDANTVFKSLKAQGYKAIRISQFTTWIVQEDADLIQAAKKVNADMVVTFSYHAGRRVVQFPFQNEISSGGFSTTNLGATATGNASGTFNGRDANGDLFSGNYSGTNQGQISGTSTTYTPPQYSTQWLPTPLDYNAFETVFMRRATGRPFHYTSEDHKI